jgi:hypothetical protein
MDSPHRFVVQASPQPPTSRKALPNVDRELRRYLDITLGSLSEVSYLLRFSRDRELPTDANFPTLDDLRDQAGKLTWRLYASLNKAGVP